MAVTAFAIKTQGVRTDAREQGRMRGQTQVVGNQRDGLKLTGIRQDMPLCLRQPGGQRRMPLFQP